MTSPARLLGPWMLTALVVGNMIGSGVFVLPAALAPYGAASLLGWAFTMGGALLLALVHAWLAQLVANHGGAYAYARQAFGDTAGFVAAWSYWTCVWTANAAIAVAFAGSLGAIWPAANATPWRGTAAALAVLWLCTAINAAGVREAGRMQLVTTALKVIPLLVFGVCGLALVHGAAYQPFNPSGQSLPSVTTATAALTLWAFLGLEAATVPTGVVRDPQRTVPRATVAGMLVAGVATMLACTAVIGLLPHGAAQGSAAPMAAAAAQTWGPAAGWAMGLVATVSCLGALNGWVLLQGQTPYAAAQDGLFPAPFARTDARGTPWFGLLLSSVLASVLIAANGSKSLVALFTLSILLSTAATLLPYVLSVLAWWRIDRGAGVARRTAAALALAYSLWALIGTGAEALLWGGVLLLLGLPVFLWQRYRAAVKPAAPDL
ncbi:amino acid permease [Dyella marensis]|jgi:APA family basic amino acid/polyamine antiporter|uniref:Arginine/agmatine antiporter n=1 Tax=Dyella marensis TaxID=500610 RepID=A0A1I2CB82_9GAMM|nr:MULTISPECIES: amino acid permease [Dyella]SFE65452.1 basic amino acid/polyamine antiporter, APA family [Dyella marensis]